MRSLVAVKAVVKRDLSPIVLPNSPQIGGVKGRMLDVLWGRLLGTGHIFGGRLRDLSLVA